MNDNLAFVHDGSFPGFLCAVAESLGSRSSSVSGPGKQAELFEDRFEVATVADRAAAIWREIRGRFGVEVADTINAAFRSDHPGIDGTLAEYIRCIFDRGEGAERDLAEPLVLAVEKAACRARREAHLHSGILRFVELADASLHARIEPDCDILPLIGDHFAARFPGLTWAIEDVRRHTAILHEPGEGMRFLRDLRVGGQAATTKSAGSAVDADRLPLSARELPVREGWRRYFETVAIESRANPRLQSSRMPRKYWGHLPEMGNYS